ncbi:hypothetical protein AgCh_032851 [Apium graveolens]
MSLLLSFLERYKKVSSDTPNTPSVSEASVQKPIVPADLYRAAHDSQLVGMSGYTKEGLPIFAIGVGLSTYDKASIHYYVQSHIQMNEYRDRVLLPSATRKYGRHINTCVKILDMTGLKLSALNQIKVTKNCQDLIEDKRVFLSNIQDDNHLDFLVSKIKIVQLPLNAARDTKLATIAICDYFYDMLYFVPFSTFLKPPQGNQQSYTSILYGMLTAQRLAPATKDVATLKKMNATVGYCGESFHKSYMINALGFDSANIKKYTSTHDYAKALKIGEIAGIFLEFASAKVFLAQYLYYNLKTPLFWLHVFRL